MVQLSPYNHIYEALRLKQERPTPQEIARSLRCFSRQFKSQIPPAEQAEVLAAMSQQLLRDFSDDIPASEAKIATRLSDCSFCAPRDEEEAAQLASNEDKVTNIETFWPPEEQGYYFEHQLRIAVSRAIAQRVAEILTTHSTIIDKHLPAAPKKSLEVGPGTGFFYQYIAPEWLKPDLALLELNPGFAKMLKEKFPETKIVHGSIYYLDKYFAPGSLRSIISYTAASTFFYLDLAIAQMHRALMPAGRFIDIHDAIPKDAIIMKLLEERGFTKFNKDKQAWESSWDDFDFLRFFLWRLSARLEARTFKVKGGTDIVTFSGPKKEYHTHNPDANALGVHSLQMDKNDPEDSWSLLAALLNHHALFQPHKESSFSSEHILEIAKIGIVSATKVNF